jgi:hypothetical protein
VCSVFGYQPDVVTYNVLISTSYKAGSLKDAKMVHCQTDGGVKLKERRRPVMWLAVVFYFA